MSHLRHYLNEHKEETILATSVAKNLYFVANNSLKFYFHILRVDLKKIFNFLVAVQKKATELIADLDVSNFFQYFYEFCSLELSSSDF